MYTVVVRRHGAAAAVTSVARASARATLRRSAVQPLILSRAASFKPRRESPPVHFGFVIVPQQRAYVVERLGKFHAVLEPGLHFLIPVVDRIAYVHSLKEEAVTVPNQTAITKDNVALQIDGVLYLRIVDPKSASYGVEDAEYALTQLAQTTMRSELGKISLDNAFAERDSLNHAIVQAINAAAVTWGTEVLRYEIKDILPPASVKTAMDMQAEAERRKRAEILSSEGLREAAINNAEGQRRSVILAAQGEAEAITARANAAARALETLAAAINRAGGREAVSMRVAEQYITAFGRIAQKGNTILLPSNAAEPAAMVAQAMSIWGTLAKQQQAGGASGAFTPADFSAASEASSAAADSLAASPTVPSISEEIDTILEAARSSANVLGGAAPAPAAAPSASAAAGGAAAAGAGGFSPKPYARME